LISRIGPQGTSIAFDIVQQLHGLELGVLLRPLPNQAEHLVKLVETRFRGGVFQIIGQIDTSDVSKSQPVMDAR
jgi:hypothetical protein